MTQHPRSLQSDTQGVSPVVGTVLVLAISVLGIAGIMAWGAPTIDRIQTRNAQAAMQGEFEGLRAMGNDLSVPDHSRFPTLAIPSGRLSIQPGTRFLVTADHDGANPRCDLHVTGWADADDSVLVSAPDCRTPISCSGPAPAEDKACLEIFSVGGASTIKQALATCCATASASVTGANFGKGDWMFRLTNGAATLPTVYAQAWLHSTDQLAWELKASTGTRSLYLEGGAVFSNTDGTYFLEKETSLGDVTFGPGYYGFWLRSLLSGSHSAIDGQGTHQVFLSLLGNSVRVDHNDVNRLRFDFSGPLAEPWCNALEARNNRLITDPGQFFAVYKADPSYPCASGGTGGLRSVCFIEFAATPTPTTTPCTTQGTPFQFRFLHARIDTSLSA